MLTGKLIFSFDIPRNKASLRVKVLRALKNINANQEMRSLWSLPYSADNRKKLQLLGIEILENNGKIEILHGRTIWKR